MLFNSAQFLIFLPIAVAAYFALPQRLRWLWLLLASYYFYMCWRPEYVVLILVSTFVDYWAGLKMGRLRAKKARRPYLIVSVVVNLGILATFKYADFFAGTVESVCQRFNLLVDLPEFTLLLPVGISFYTFQSLGYSIDVYRGQVKPERHFGYFALYVTYFPQLVAGPIERYSHLAPQFRVEKNIEYDRIASGLGLMAWGFFKKVVIADRLAAWVDPVYADPALASGPGLLLATYCFAFQIYCDFSGYSDIAIGTARVLGHDLRANFRTPYLATSIRDFWQRWHISLSTWFRDYVYIPLGGGRGGWLAVSAAVLVTFLASGLWHGANWTFVVWGGVHGCLLLGGRLLHRLRAGAPAPTGALYRGLSIAVTFHLVLLGWVFFRAENIADAGTVLARIFQGATGSDGYAAVVPLPALWPIAASLSFLLIVESVEPWLRMKEGIAKLSFVLRAPVYAAFVAVILILGEFDSQDFLYFQF